MIHYIAWDDERDKPITVCMVDIEEAKDYTVDWPNPTSIRAVLPEVTSELIMAVAKRWYNQAPDSWQEDDINADDLRKDVGQVLRCLQEELGVYIPVESPDVNPT